MKNCEFESDMRTICSLMLKLPQFKVADYHDARTKNKKMKMTNCSNNFSIEFLFGQLVLQMEKLQCVPV